MNFTTTITTKNQLTLPKTVRDKLGIKKGMKFDIFLTSDGFVGRLKRKSKILDFLGDLSVQDDGKPLSQVRQESQRLAATKMNSKI